MQLQLPELEPDVEYIKIHGLQRTGTNFITNLVNENFEKTKVLVNIGGWKHGCYCAPWTLQREVHVLIIVKNPYSWLVSMYKWWGPEKKFTVGPDLTGVSFQEFVRSRAIFEESEGAPVLYRAVNPIQHWNNMNFHWLSIGLNTKQKAVVPFEYAALRPEMALAAIGHAFSLRRKTDVCMPEDEFLPGEEDQVTSGQKWQARSYYADARYMAWYDQSTLDFVNQQIDMDLMNHLGYAKVESLCSV